MHGMSPFFLDLKETISEAAGIRVRQAGQNQAGCNKTFLMVRCFGGTKIIRLEAEQRKAYSAEGCFKAE